MELRTTIIYMQFQRKGLEWSKLVIIEFQNTKYHGPYQEKKLYESVEKNNKIDKRPKLK